MKVLRRYSYVEVLGVIWLPQITAAAKIDLSTYDIGNMTNEAGTIAREDLEQWLATQAGDFQSITDFAASIELGDETIDIPWTNEENEMSYNDCMYPEHD